jgi:hypothetical protein
MSAAVQEAVRVSNERRETWRQQAVHVRCMGDENGGWGTDAEYRAACRVRDALLTRYAESWAVFARAVNAQCGAELLDPERAQ